MIPAFIFAQDGTIRAVYSTNQHMTKEECDAYGIEYVDYDNTEETWGNATYFEKIPASSTSVTSYGQGIGSGAGNLEKSNGVFLPLSQKN